MIRFLARWLALSGCLALISAGNVSCLQATDARVACQGSSGSSTQAVLPAWKTEDSQANAFAGFDDYLKNNRETLARTAGMGGFLAWGELPEGVQSPFQVATDKSGKEILDLDGQPQVTTLFRDDLSQCTVHFTAAKFPEVVVWTSLNCVDWGKVTSKTIFWLSTDRLNEAVAVKPSRSAWPLDVRRMVGRANAQFAENLKSSLGRSSAESSDGGVSAGVGAQAVASVVNFDRFVVTVVGDGTAQDHMKEKLTAVQSARAAGVNTTSAQIRDFLVEWIELTEAQAVFRALSAFDGRNCELTGNSDELCEQLLQGLKDEYTAVSDVFRLTEKERGLSLKSFDDFKVSLASALKSAPDSKSKFYWANQKKSFDRKRLFEDLTSWLQGGVSGEAVDESGRSFGFGYSNILFLHAMIGLADSSQKAGQVELKKVKLRDLVYQALPLDVLFKFSALTSAQSPAVQILRLKNPEFSLKTSVNDFGGLLFRSPAQFGARDEGAMISFQGYYPMAFVTHPDVAMGSFSSSGREDESTAPVTYNSSPCQ